MLHPYLQAWREEGQDMAEYALLIALIVILMIGLMSALGQKLNTLFFADFPGHFANMIR